MLKKLTLLHSNDLHGDFMTEQIDDKLVGGVSMLSGYVDKVRREEDHVIYAIAGDMFRGSLIDSEYQGISTIEIMNMLAPDIVTIGNHEVDYGLSHLLFIEKCASFPIINANMYLTLNHTRLFESHKIFRIGGMKVLFIGILTEDVLAQTRQERIIGSLVNVEDAAQEGDVFRVGIAGSALAAVTRKLVEYDTVSEEGGTSLLKDISVKRIVCGAYI